MNFDMLIKQSSNILILSFFPIFLVSIKRLK